MKKLALGCSTFAALLTTAAMPAMAQEAGDIVVRAAAARTRLVDEGVIRTNGVVDPAAGYSTRETYHGVASLSYYPVDLIGIDFGVTTPATTNNVPAGSLAGTPNLGDDEFIVLTLGARVQPFRGPVQPYVAGGYALHITTQERDGLGVGLDIANTHGPYVEGGVEFNLTPRFGLFAAARKYWYTTSATGLLPLDATYTSFASVDADAQLDPFTVMVGATARFGRSADSAEGEQIGPDNSRWLIRAGLTQLRLADRLDLVVDSNPLLNSGMSTFEHETPTVQIGYFLTPHFAVNATLGLPPTIEIYGSGSIGALPTLGRVTYGPTAFTLQYHPLRHGRIRPWIGAGVSYMIMFDTEDGAFQNLEVEDDLALAFEAGTEILVGQDWGLFFDVKHALLRPQATGTFNGMSVVGETRLDPWAITGGIALHF